MRYIPFFVIILAGFFLVAKKAPGQSLRPHQYQGILFVACGAGDQGNMYDSVKLVAAESRLPLHVLRWEWGTGDIVADIKDHSKHREAGRKLAHYINGLQPEHGKVYLLGFSAGTSVMLATADQTPPGKIERVILLGSGVSHRYDLRTSLAHTRTGIDNFYSCEDNLVDSLTFGVATNDGGPYPCAGFKGFTPVITSEADAQLYRNLRQYAWKDPGRRPNHGGGHAGYARPSFVASQIMPLLRASLANP